MKKSILKVGKVLNRSEQKQINGGVAGKCGSYYGNTFQRCVSNSDCNEGVCHNWCCNTAV